MVRRPERSATVHTEVLNDEVCLYDWQHQQVHALNPTAARVWQLCDGATTEAEIVAHLAADWRTDQAATVVRLALAEFDEKHLLRNNEASPVAASLSRRQAMKRLGLAAAALPVVTSIVAPRAVDAASVVSGSTTFTYSGASQSFTVPTGVTAVTIIAAGAQGGNATGTLSVGGQGGSVTATIPVTPGETLAVYVGGAGGNGTVSTAGAAGFNGGGLGPLGAGACGGGGGGASDVRQGGTALGNRVVVAGGGGGGGWGSATVAISGGGVGGGTIGGTGVAGAGGNGGGGGTQIVGGAGGTSVNGGTTGGNGSLGTGGDGGNVNGTDKNGGGGGGGGYYGGGGGGGQGFGIAGGPGGGGGGGGSSYYPSTATGVTNTQGGHAGNGQVVISW